MPENLKPPAPPPVQSESKGRNCWLVGCSGCLIVLLLMVLLGFAGIWWVRKTFMVEPFDPIELSETEAAKAEEKLKSLNLLGEDGQAVEEFEMPEEGLLLSENEVNYWISQQDEELADSVRLDFEPGQIRAELRWAEPGSQQRWNLSGTVSVEQTETGLDVRLLDLRMGGFALPKAVIDEAGKENLAAEVFSDPEVQKDFQEKVEKIEVLKDQILLVPKKK
jgi:hypothetical protein